MIQPGDTCQHQRLPSIFLMTVRYYVPDLPTAGGWIDLSDGEAHHAISVMRIRVGEAVVLFDGRGHQAAATVVATSKRHVQCEAQSSVLWPGDNLRPLTIGVSLPKGDRARDLVERLTELGVSRLVPLQCQRSPWKNSDNAIEKLRRVVIEACKQCGRNQLMAIDAPQTFTDYGNQPPADGIARLLAHPGGVDLLGDPTAAATPPLPDSLLAASGYDVAVGPEGGFSDDEVDLALAAGWTAVGLGTRILRIETAAIAIAVLTQARLQWN